ncbi:hypothetical protein BDF20DRAFT_693853 [Mycotypha africana]|uniref:uncharacterized protein n=1 Tax=Mycotypha africana TaxID=64632 RepID=UPI0023009E6C|nr:uncharacterized protein BDF20DRAFT_693853 [Mycotypha africana]KAI8971689.1 hypothetical protein BDF20DRAFT_693853 [Mycotypha africana]
MLPETMLEELASNGSTGTNNKPNKGAILRKSVDHIRLLQQEVSSHKQRIFELERQLAGLTTNAVSNKTNSTPTAATATTLTHTTAMSL